MCRRPPLASGYYLRKRQGGARSQRLVRGPLAAPARLAGGAGSGRVRSGSLTWIKRRRGLSGPESDPLTVSLDRGHGVPALGTRSASPVPSRLSRWVTSSGGLGRQPGLGRPSPGALPRTSAPVHWFAGLGPASATEGQHREGRNDSCPMALLPVIVCGIEEGRRVRERKIGHDARRYTFFRSSGY